MNLITIRQTYYDFSGKASDISRQLCFAGIALIWLFKTEKGDLLGVPGVLLIPASLFALSLAFDSFQYIYCSASWALYARHLEAQNISEEEEIDFPLWINWPTLTCFWLKLVFVLIGYTVIFQYIKSLLPKI